MVPWWTLIFAAIGGGLFGLMGASLMVVAHRADELSDADYVEIPRVPGQHRAPLFAAGDLVDPPRPGAFTDHERERLTSGLDDLIDREVGVMLGDEDRHDGPPTADDWWRAAMAVPVRSSPFVPPGTAMVLNPAQLVLNPAQLSRIRVARPLEGLGAEGTGRPVRDRWTNVSGIR